MVKNAESQGQMLIRNESRNQLFCDVFPHAKWHTVNNKPNFWERTFPRQGNNKTQSKHFKLFRDKARETSTSWKGPIKLKHKQEESETQHACVMTRYDNYMKNLSYLRAARGVGARNTKNQDLFVRCKLRDIDFVCRWVLKEFCTGQFVSHLQNT